MQRQVDYDVLGFSIVGPPPVGVVHIRWDPTLTVLYGANGVGKSVLLRALEACVVGRRLDGARAFLHLRIHGWGEPADWQAEGQREDFILHLTNHLKTLWMEPGETDQFIEGGTDSIAALELVERSEQLDSLVRVAAVHRMPEITDADWFAGVFSLEAAGEQDPSWILYGCAQPTEDTTSIREYLIAHRAEADEAAERFNTSRPVDAIENAWAARYPFGHFKGVLPSWVPVPVLCLGTYNNFMSVLPRLVPVDLPGTRTERGGEPPARVVALQEREGWFRPDPAAVARLTNEAVDATDLLAQFLPDAPRLHATINAPSEWWQEGIVSWCAEDPWTGARVSLSALSEAQQRWAVVAIALAGEAQSKVRAPRILILDEPEQALHAAACRHVAAATARLPEMIGGPVVAATHAAQFLDLDGVTLLHVTRGPLGASEVAPLGPEAAESLDRMAVRLGVERADLLRLIRTFLIVEGEHDRVVVECILGPELAQRRVRVLSAAGARRIMNVADGEILLDFTNADIVVALDNTRSEPVETYEVAKEVARSGDVATAKRMVLQGGEGSRSPEEKLAISLSHRAIANRVFGRVRLFGFSKPDIIMYLPVDQLVPGASSWAELHEEWRTQAGRSATPLPFKPWLKRYKGASINVTRLAALASNLDTRVHADFQRLFDTCCDVGGS